MSRTSVVAWGVILALALGFALIWITSPAHAYAQPYAPVLSPGFSHLVEHAADTVGIPLDSERPGDVDGSTIVPTTTGLLYWQDGVMPSWTNGYDRLTLDVVDQVVSWVGDQVHPPAPPTPTPTILSPRSLSGVDARIYCIEGIESTHGAHMYNRVDIYGRLDGPGPHAAGWLGWLGGTAAHWGAIIGDRESEWAAARRMFASSSEAFMRSQFAGVGSGQC